MKGWRAHGRLWTRAVVVAGALHLLSMTGEAADLGEPQPLPGLPGKRLAVPAFAQVRGRTLLVTCARWPVADPAWHGLAWLCARVSPDAGTIGEWQRIIPDSNVRAAYNPGTDPRFEVYVAGQGDRVVIATEAVKREVAVIQMRVFDAHYGLVGAYQDAFADLTGAMLGGARLGMRHLMSPTVCGSEPTGTVLLAGSSPDGLLWTTKVGDWGDGRAIGARVVGRGRRPRLLRTEESYLLVFVRAADQERGTEGLHVPATQPPGALGALESEDGLEWREPAKFRPPPLASVSDFAVCTTRRGRAVLVYSQVTNGHAHLWLTASADDGQSWSEPRELTDGLVMDTDPAITSSDTDLLVAFVRTTGTSRALCLLRVPSALA